MSFLNAESPLGQMTDGQRCTLGNHRRAGHIHTKAFSERFGFDDVRISQIQTSSQNQSNGNAP